MVLRKSVRSGLPHVVDVSWENQTMMESMNVVRKVVLTGVDVTVVVVQKKLGLVGIQPSYHAPKKIYA